MDSKYLPIRPAPNFGTWKISLRFSNVLILETRGDSKFLIKHLDRSAVLEEIRGFSIVSKETKRSTYEGCRNKKEHRHCSLGEAFFGNFIPTKCHKAKNKPAAQTTW